MSVLSNWVMTLHRASVDSSSVPYTEVLKTTISAYANYATTTAYTTAQQGTWEVVTSDSASDVAGNLSNAGITRRRIFNVVLYPHTYNDGSEPDLTDIDSLIAFLTEPNYYYWVDFVGGSRTYPSTSTKVHPIRLAEWSESINMEYGTRTVTLKLEVRSLS